MKNLNFQKCTLSDWQQLQKISIDTFTHTYQHKNDPSNFKQHLEKAFNDDQLKKELENPNCEFYFLIKENELVGYLKFNELDAQTEPMFEEDFEIERIYVINKFQGKGLGKQMMEFAKEKAIQKKKKKIWLGVWSENPKAIGFYQKMGFQQIGTHVFKVGDDEQLDYVMALEIRNSD